MLLCGVSVRLLRCSECYYVVAKVFCVLLCSYLGVLIVLCFC